MRLHIKMGKSFISVPCTPNVIRRLQDSEIMGRRFIEINGTHYNISMIESWWYDEEDGEQLAPLKPKSMGTVTVR